MILLCASGRKVRVPLRGRIILVSQQSLDIVRAAPQSCTSHEAAVCRTGARAGRAADGRVGAGRGEG